MAKRTGEWYMYMYMLHWEIIFFFKMNNIVELQVIYVKLLKFRLFSIFSKILVIQLNKIKIYKIR